MLGRLEKNILRTLIFKIFLLFFLLIAILLLIFILHKRSNIIFIGFVTEEANAQIMSEKNAAQAAVDSINASGGLVIQGKKFQLSLLTADGKNNVRKTQQAVQTLIANHVAAIVGSASTQFATSEAQVAQLNKVLYLSSADASVNVTIDPLSKRYLGFVYRSSFDSSYEAASLGYFASGILKKNNAAVFYDTKDPSSATEAQSFEQAFGTSANTRLIPINSVANLSSQVNVVKRTKPEVMYIAMPFETGEQILRQVRAASADGILLVNQDWENASFIRQCSKACEGGFLVSQFNPTSDSVNVKSFVSSYKQKYHRSPSTASALVYDSVMLVKQAMVASSDNNAESVFAAFTKLRSFSGVTGTVQFLPGSHDPQRTVFIKKIDSENARFYQELDPKMGY